MLNKTILVIESQPYIFLLLRDRLQCQLENVLLGDISAGNIEQVHSRNVDLIVINTRKLTSELVRFYQHQQNKSPAATGILITEEKNPEILIEAVNAGISRVYRQSLSDEELIVSVLETLEGKDVRSEVARLKALLPVYDLGRKFISAQSEGAIYEELVETVARELNVKTVSVLLFDQKENVLKLVASKGLNSEFVKNLVIQPGERIAGKVFQDKAPVILNRKSRMQSPFRDMMERKELAAAICFPFISKEKTVLGVLNISETANSKEFCEADVDMLNIITDQALMAVENLRFVEQKEEQTRIRFALEQYISPEISEVLVSRGGTKQLLDIGGIQDLTVLFADIRNFTMLAQAMPLDRLRLFLNDFFQVFSQAVFAEKGMLDKFMGDAVLAVFGAPVQQDNPCGAAVSAACKISRDFQDLKEKWRKESDTFEQVALGLGVSRGPMFLGNVGSSERLDYTVLGLDVNIAQRLASESQAGRVYVTEPVCSRLDEKFIVKETIRKKLRGVLDETTLYVVELK